MPTRRGWAVLGLAVGLIILWVLLGEREVLAAGVVLGSLVVLGFAWIRFGRPDLPLARRVNPEWVQEGDDVVITLELTNVGRFPLVGVRVTDPIHGIGRSAVTVAHLPGRTAARVPYRIHTTRRGVFRVGPAHLSIGDPLGLVTRGANVGRADTLIVYPRADPLRGHPIVRGRDPSIQASRPEFSARGGEDFFTIREYRHGDDLRRVHWKTTARRDELMIRQFEMPWQSRGLLVLDTRAEVHDLDTFETAVRGAASAYLHLTRLGFELDVLVGAEHLRPKNQGPEGPVLAALAGVEPNPALDLRAVFHRLRRRFVGGLLVMVTGNLDEHAGAAVASLGPDFGSVLVLSATRGSLGPLPSLRAPLGAAVCPPGGTWTEAWDRMQARSWASA